MSDLVFLAIVLAFFAVAAGLLRACERLVDTDDAAAAGGSSSATAPDDEPEDEEAA